MNSIWLNAVRASRAAAAANWWDDLTDVVAVYQPIGAASLAASYVNLVNPGTFDAAPGVAPTHSAATGWGFLRTSGNYLITGIVAAAAWSIFIRFSDVPLSGAFEYTLIGASTGSNRTWLQPYPGTTAVRQYRNTGATQLNVATAVASGVMGFAGNQAYYNSALDGTIVSGPAPTDALFVGANNQDGIAGRFLSGNIQAIAICSSTQTAPQIAAVSAAMAAL